VAQTISILRGLRKRYEGYHGTYRRFSLPRDDLVQLIGTNLVQIGLNTVGVLFVMLLSKRIVVI
jgi:hypothetical protein